MMLKNVSYRHRIRCGTFQHVSQVTFLFFKSLIKIAAGGIPSQLDCWVGNTWCRKDEGHSCNVFLYDRVF